MNKKIGQASVALVLFILGLMISLQYRSIQNGGSNVTSQRVDELTTQLTKTESDKQALTTQLYQVQEKLDKYENAASKVNAVTSSLRQDNENLKMIAGLVAVHGPGITITLNDAAVVVQPGQDSSADLIHDTDLLQVINELKASGAEAISINGQRVVSTTEIRCIGPTISVNTKRFSTPFVIKAIGDPQTLDAGMELKGGIIDTLKYYGLEVTIKQSNDLTVPAYDGTIQLDHTKEVADQGGVSQ